MARVAHALALDSLSTVWEVVIRPTLHSVIQPLEMSSRLKYSAPSAAVCLGDELQELSDEEQRQLRIEMENQKDQYAERWQIEADVSGP